jgi:hypothetical protein
MKIKTVTLVSEIHVVYTLLASNFCIYKSWTGHFVLSLQVRTQPYDAVSNQKELYGSGALYWSRMKPVIQAHSSAIYVINFYVVRILNTLE